MIFVPETQLLLTSPAFQDNETIPTQYTCDGENVSPPLQVSGIPEGTKSLVLILDDPDSPSGTFIHWLLYDIPPTTLQILSAQIPAGSLEGNNSFGQLGFGGPCPHQGEHRYVFTLYALDTLLKIRNLNRAELETSLRGHILAQAVLTGKYQRPTTI